MITPEEIKNKAQKKYFGYLQNLVSGIAFEKIIIAGNKVPPKSLAELEQAVIALAGDSKEKKGFGYTIDFQKVNTKTTGTQSLPVSIYFSNETDFLRYLGKSKEKETFMFDVDNIVTTFPSLKPWIMKNPNRVVENHGKWPDLLKVCMYFHSNPKPGLYIRELPISIHTKFIERNKSTLRELLDIIIEPSVDKTVADFEKRFNLKFREPLVRFKILDHSISARYFSGLQDISIPVSEFELLNLPLKQLIIVENKTTLYTTLTLPPMTATIAIYGQGNAVANIANAAWVKNIQVYYWGDLDIHGFEMLSLTRRQFTNTKSILMDEATFSRFFENETGSPSTNKTDLILTDEERKLYDKLKANNWRLEQEKLPLQYIIKATYQLRLS